MFVGCLWFVRLLAVVCLICITGCFVVGCGLFCVL